MEQLRVCIISKYPPIQGGMSSAAFWLARGLASSGVEVHVVSDGNIVEDEYRINDDFTNGSQGLTVHFVSNKLPWYIPYTEQRLAKLIDTALAVCKKHDIDIVDAQYLVPYGFVGSIINSFTGIPYVFRHGGSDIAKFLNNGYFPLLTKHTLRGAAVTVSDNPILKSLAKRIEFLPRYIPHCEDFAPKQKKSRPITCAYIGKVNHYWRHKSLHMIANIIKGSGIKMVYLSQGKGMEDFKQTCNPEGVFHEFIHPSKMPEFLNKIDYLFYYQGESPLVDFANIVLEAVSMGIPILTDRVDLFAKYQDYFAVENWVIQIDPSVTGVGFARFLEGIKKPQPVPLKIGYDHFIRGNIALYNEVLSMSE